MDYSMIILGFGAGIIFTAIVALLYRILNFIEKDPEVALSKLFLKEEALKGFKVLAISTLTVSAVMAFEAANLLLGNAELAAIARYLAPVPMLGYLYFYIQLYDTTKPYSHD